ncbi:MAG TPA: SDR family oxidoreductase [Acidimicrobiales bacterium]|nr:SDR family oxidoreductase [Acidimicrobiales bacterium]
MNDRVSAGAQGTRELFDLTGRRAIVTGGAGLLGRRFAAALVDLGAITHVLDRDAEAAAKVAGELTGPGEAVAVACDITDEADVDRAVAGIAAGGPVDVLVNSAAVDPKAEGDGTTLADAGFSDYPLAAWRRSMDVNLTGTFLVTRAVCRVMEQRSTPGVIVNISSTYGLAGPDQRIYERADGTRSFKPLDYSVTKAGVLGFTRALAAHYRGTGIRVNALTPGGAFNEHDDEFVAAYSARTILGRMARPDEYRGAIAFLCSDASSYMTGANLIVDGGWTAW